VNLFEMIKALYEEKDTKWIDQITPEELATSHPVVITKFLSMNKELTWQLPILNDYSIILDTRNFLFIAWALLPKCSAPYCPYIKPLEEGEFSFVWDKFKHYTEVKGNDFKAIRKRLELDFKSNMADWFSSLGIEQKYWKKYNVVATETKPVGLGVWF